MRILLFVLALLSLTACSNKAKHKLGLTTTGPDEYKVEKNQPLEVPPHYNLPEPESKK